ncbi:MAG: HAD family hydrolase [Gammaproteobacteria bacterium]|nr:MAG: HAD family hydrolase [Gammaproteobacteria bacterium]
MSNIRLITLDLDDTLWSVTPVILRAEKVLYQWMQETLPEVLEHYHREGLSAFRQQATQSRPELAKLPTTFRKQFLNHCFSQVGLQGAALNEHVEAAFTVFHKARNEIDFYPQTLPLLTTLKQDFTLIALSNGNADLHMVGLAGYFQAHFSAESTGKPKPDPTMFKAALAHSGTAPEQAIHVGDHPIEDIEAANSAGFHTIWFNQNNQNDAASCSPSREIHQLEQLPGAIQELLD